MTFATVFFPKFKFEVRNWLNFANFFAHNYDKACEVLSTGFFSSNFGKYYTHGPK